MRVFVSSTCYDLLDLRCEIEAHLRELGLDPLLSDRPSSEFAVLPKANSIEACLANVRDSDVFVCILSQRYGRSLAKAGYADVSATHLEWIEAQNHGKPIYMYVRDRTEGDYGVWKKNPGVKLTTPWVQDLTLLNFLDEHRKLVAASPTTNWIWTFRDSVELKARLSQDLRSFSGRAMLRRWLEAGRLPALRLYAKKRHGSGVGINKIDIGIAVRSSLPAVSVQVAFSSGAFRHVPDILPGVDAVVSAEYQIPHAPTPFEAEVTLTYDTSFGATIEDKFRVSIPLQGADVAFALASKRLVSERTFQIA